MFSFLKPFLFLLSYYSLQFIFNFTIYKRYKDESSNEYGVILKIQKRVRIWSMYISVLFIL